MKTRTAIALTLACLALLLIFGAVAGRSSGEETYEQISMEIVMDEDTSFSLRLETLFEPGYVSVNASGGEDFEFSLIDPDTLNIQPVPDYNGAADITVSATYRVYDLDPPFGGGTLDGVRYVQETRVVRVTVRDMPDVYADEKDAISCNVASLFTNPYDTLVVADDFGLPVHIDGGILWIPRAGQIPGDYHIEVMATRFSVSRAPLIPNPYVESHTVHINIHDIPEVVVNEDAAKYVDLRGHFPSGATGYSLVGPDADYCWFDPSSMTLRYKPAKDATGYRNVTLRLSYADGTRESHRIEVFVRDMPDIYMDMDWETSYVDLGGIFGFIPQSIYIGEDYPLETVYDPATGILSIRGEAGWSGGGYLNITGYEDAVQSAPGIPPAADKATVEIEVAPYPQVVMDEDTVLTTEIGSFFPDGWSGISVEVGERERVRMTPDGKATLVPERNRAGWWNVTVYAYYQSYIDPPFSDTIMMAPKVLDHRLSVHLKDMPDIRFMENRRSGPLNVSSLFAPGWDSLTWSGDGDIDVRQISPDIFDFKGRTNWFGHGNVTFVATYGEETVSHIVHLQVREVPIINMVEDGSGSVDVARFFEDGAGNFTVALADPDSGTAYMDGTSVVFTGNHNIYGWCNLSVTAFYDSNGSAETEYVQCFVNPSPDVAMQAYYPSRTIDLDEYFTVDFAYLDYPRGGDVRCAYAPSEHLMTFYSDYGWSGYTTVTVNAMSADHRILESRTIEITVFPYRRLVGREDVPYSLDSFLDELPSNPSAVEFALPDEMSASYENGSYILRYTPQYYGTRSMSVRMTLPLEAYREFTDPAELWDPEAEATFEFHAMTEVRPMPDIYFDTDSAVSVPLGKYLPPGWESVTVSQGNHVVATVDGDILLFNPAPGWSGDDSFVIHAVYPQPIECGNGVVSRYYEVPGSIVVWDGLRLGFDEDTETLFDLDPEVFPSGWSSVTGTGFEHMGYMADPAGRGIIFRPELNYYGNVEGRLYVHYAGDRPFQGDLYEFDDYVTRTCRITVHPVNDAPVAAVERGRVSIFEDVPVDVSEYTGWFTDVDSELTWTVSSGDMVNARLENGMLSLEPAPDAYGSEVIYLTAMDEEYFCRLPVDVFVLPVNDPVVQTRPLPAVFDCEDNGPYTALDLDWYFDDVDGDLIRYRVETLSPGLECELDGSVLTVLSEENWNGDGVISITAWDGHEETRASIQVYLEPVNDAPQVSGSVALSMPEDTTSDAFDLSLLFTDVDSNLTYYVECDGCPFELDGTVVRFRGLPDAYGSFTATVTAFDGQYSVATTIPVEILPVNDAPVKLVERSCLRVMENTSFEPVPLANYFMDVDSQLTYSVSAPEGIPVRVVNGNLEMGAVSWMENGTLLVVTASDGEFEATTEILLSFSEVNSRPVVRRSGVDIFSAEDESIIIRLGDYIVDWDSSLTWTIEAGDEVSSYKISGGFLTLNLLENYHGTIPVTLVATDGEFFAESALSLRISPVNDAPRVASTVTQCVIEEDTALEFDLSALFSDVDSTLVFGSEVGSVTDGILSYTPPKDWNGELRFRVWADDGDETAEAVIALCVEPVMDPPVAVFSSPIEMLEDTPLEIPIEQLFHDADGGATYTVMAGDGITAVLEDGIIVITPSEEWNGETTLSVSFEDVESGEAVFPVRVGCVNDVPRGRMVSFVVDEDETLSFSGWDMFADDGDSLVFSASVVSGHSSVEVSGDEITVTPWPDWNGRVRVMVVASDGEYTATAMASVDVSPVYDPVTAESTAVSVILQDDRAVSIAMDELFENPDDAHLRYWFSSGDVEMSAHNDTFTISAPGGVSGTETVVVYVSDGKTTVSRSILVTDGMESREASGGLFPVDMVDTLSIMGIAIAFLAVIGVTMLAQYTLRKELLA